VLLSANAPAVKAQGNISINLSGLTTGTTATADMFALGAVQSGTGSIDLTVNGGSSPNVVLGNFTVAGTTPTILLNIPKVNQAVTSTLTTGGGKATYVGPVNKASTVTITIANTVEITGGSLADKFTITGTGSTTAKTLVVSGDTGFSDNGVDAVYINGTGTVLYTAVDASGLKGFTGKSVVVIGAAETGTTTPFPATVLSYKGSSTRDFINVPLSASAEAAITITGGAGNDIFRIAGDATAANLIAVVSGSTTKFTIKKPIIITDFSNGNNQIVGAATGASDSLGAPTAITVNSGTLPTAGASQVMRGSYAAGEFTYSATGADTLYIANTTGAGTYVAVLQGYTMPSSAASGPTTKVVEVGVLDAGVNTIYTGLFSA